MQNIEFHNYVDIENVFTIVDAIEFDRENDEVKSLTVILDAPSARTIERAHAEVDARLTAKAFFEKALETGIKALVRSKRYSVETQAAKARVKAEDRLTARFSELIRAGLDKPTALAKVAGENGLDITELTLVMLPTFGKK